MRIVVNTPAGNIGRTVADQLLEANEAVIIISRHPKKVADLVKRDAHLVEGSIDDPAVLDRALISKPWILSRMPRAMEIFVRRAWVTGTDVRVRTRSPPTGALF